jgi:hypothetical protein
VTPEEKLLLIERCVSAHRRVDPRGERLHAPEFYDLEEDDRARVFDATLEQRRIEAALSPTGRSSTVAAVLAAIRRVGP